MANWWDDAPLAQAPQAPAMRGGANWWDEAPLAQQAAPPAIDNAPNELGVPVFNKAQSRADLDKAMGPIKSGSVLPVSWNHKGEMNLDWNAGIPGALQRAFSAPHEAMTGELQPDWKGGDMSGRATEFASAVMPDAAPLGSPVKQALMTKPKIAAPSADDLFKASQEGYASLRNSGVEYEPKAVWDAMGGYQKQMADEARDIGAKDTFSFLDRFRPPEVEPGANASIPFGRMEAARQELGNYARDFNNPKEAAAASGAIRHLDQFMAEPPAGSILAGSGEEVGPAIRMARGNYASGSRSNALNNLEEAADLRTSAANSGKNYDNSIRSRLASLTQRNPGQKLSRAEKDGFSPEEIDAAKSIIRGSPVQNALRSVGNRLGGGGGAGSTVIGGAAGGLAMAAGLDPATAAQIGVGVAGAGHAAKFLENGMTAKDFSRLEAAVRKRSPLYEQMRAAAPDVVGRKNPYATMSASDPIIRALLLQQMQQGR